MTRGWHRIVLLIAAATAVAAVAAVLMITRDRADGAAPASPSDLQAAGEAALSLVSFDPGMLDATVRFAPARPDVRAQAELRTRTVTVYLRADEAAHIVAHDIAHELGHLYDAARLTSADRERYLVARGVPGGAWEPSGESDYGVGAGDFAEVFASCYAASPEFRSELAPRPDAPCDLLPREVL